MSLDFTLEKYTQFCEAVKSLSCPVMTVKQFLQSGQPQAFVIVLRHDVDRSLPSALRMAKLEASYGISASYYVRTTPPLDRPREIKRLSQLGHEVGYHYEVLTKANGNTKKISAGKNITTNPAQKIRKLTRRSRSLARSSRPIPSAIPGLIAYIIFVPAARRAGV